MREAIGTGESIEKAIDNAILELGINKETDEYDHEIIEIPAKGFLGLGNKPAKVRVWTEVEGKPVPKKAINKEVEKNIEETSSQEVNYGNKVELVEKYVKDIIAELDIEGIDVSSAKEGKIIKIQISGDEEGITIGHRGETLDAIQYLAGLAANKGEGDYVRVTVNSGTYRDKRRQTLEALAKRLANNAVKSGHSIKLEAMNPFDRRIIHSSVSEVKGATSYSAGEEPNRYVIISPINAKSNIIEDGSTKKSNKNYRDNKRKGPREKKQSYKETGTREIPPIEALNHELYGKIEL